MRKRFMLVFVLILTVAFGAFAAKLDVAGYKQEIGRIFKAVEDASKPLTTLNPADVAGAGKVYKGVIETVTPLYKELGTLEAPDSLKGAHEKLVAGSDATLEALKIATEMVGIAGNPSATANPDTMKKIQELQTKAGSLAPKLLGMQEAMVEIEAAK
ncbi:MAG: hypothetical protein LBT51_09790 [Fusobacteriaceae bacterium]|jgi:hypothetical protein|nr:hypothetical protein [Fusobacteriaceae bacterium]